MPPKPSITLTDAELRLMKLLWARGESSVSDLQTALPESDGLAYTSILTTVRILETKGYVRHRKQGRAFLYTAVVQETQAGSTALRQTLARFFNNSREQLLLSVLGDAEISPDELVELKKRIAEAE
jgi:predicted transcriptional regulator